MKHETKVLKEENYRSKEGEGNAWDENKTKRLNPKGSIPLESASLT
jgi:hypothetical protein